MDHESRCAGDLCGTFNDTIKTIERSKDPLRKDHVFCLLTPKPEFLNYRSNGLFRFLGVDLIETTLDGRAIVYFPFDVIGSVRGRLLRSGARLERCDTIPVSMRIDSSCLSKAGAGVLDVVIELQPVLTRRDFDLIVGAITDLISDSNEVLFESGQDISGRHWLRGELSESTIRTVVDDYFSVQSIHEPVFLNVM